MDESLGQNPAIEVRGLVKKFGFRSVLRDIDLVLNGGKILALFGPNGAGKTTLLKILCSLMLPTSGKVSVKGLDPKHDREELCKEIGVILDGTFLYKHFTAKENLRFYGRLYGVEKLNERIAQLLELVGLTHCGDEYVNTFSKGMLQRLSIARAIINDPSVLFFDEPYNGLDQQGVEILRTILEEFKEQGKTVVITSHDIDRGLELCDEIAILRGGRLVFTERISSIPRDDFKRLYSDLSENKGAGGRLGSVRNNGSSRVAL
ncbi:MAG: ABC transporter ATP-binding protein [Deltaproteobacteria bacterium]|nr:ABC transporter ATP-binding protein [Deltaproteobacteria bacterium]